MDKYNEGRQQEEAPKWQGYQPNANTLYPNEIMADYAFLPFGAGPRKCLGDQVGCCLTLALARPRVSTRARVSDAFSGPDVGGVGRVWGSLR